MMRMTSFAWRPKVMEHCVVDAIRDIISEGVVKSHMRPGCERVPPDHVELCLKSKEDPFARRRADISIETTNSHRKVLYVGTTNVISRSALRSNVKTHMARIVDTKTKDTKMITIPFPDHAERAVGAVVPRQMGGNDRTSRSRSSQAGPSRSTCAQRTRSLRPR